MKTLEKPVRSTLPELRDAGARNSPRKFTDATGEMKATCRGEWWPDPGGQNRKPTRWKTGEEENGRTNPTKEK